MLKILFKQKLFFCLLFAPFCVSAQDSLNFSLQKLLDTAIAAHPYISAGKMQVDLANMRKQGSVTIPKTEFQFIFGNINDAFGRDYIVQVMQNVPFPSLFAAQKSFAQSQTEAAGEMAKLRVLEVKRNIRRGFLTWQAAKEKEKVWEEHVLLLSKMLKIAEARFAAGETDISEKSIAEMQIEQAQNDLLAAKSSTQAAFLDLKRVCFLSFNFTTTDSFEKNTFHAEKLNNPLVVFYQKNIEAAEKKVIVERRKTLPDLTFGYYSPSFAGFNRPFHVGILGISIPIFYTSFQKNIQIAKKEVETARTELLLQENNFQTELEILLKRKIQLLVQLDNFENKMLPKTQKLIDLSEKRYHKGESDFLYVAEMRKQAYQTKIAYLQNLTDFNLLQADLMFLAGE
jgi:cobalt-zinc-cadmium resistance protein CzcA